MTPPLQPSPQGDNNPEAAPRSLSARLGRTVAFYVRSVAPNPGDLSPKLVPRPAGLPPLAYLRSRVHIDAGPKAAAQDDATVSTEILTGRVFDIRSFRRVVLLPLHLSNEQRLQNLILTAQSWSTVRNQSLVEVFGICVLGPRTYAVEARTDPIPVREYVHSHPQFDRWAIALGAARGLAALHSRSIYHGDLNIIHVFIASDGRILLGGFQYRADLDPVPLDDGQGDRFIPAWAKLKYNEPEPEPPQNSTLPDNPNWLGRHALKVQDRFPKAAHQEFRAFLLSHDQTTDLFAFGFLLLAVFRDLASTPYDHDLPLIRRVINGEEPRRPTHRSCWIFGLTDTHWNAMLSAWRRDTQITAEEIATSFAQLRRSDNVVKCPVYWSLEDKQRFVTQRKVPSFTTEISEVSVIRDGRDIERGDREVKARLLIRPGESRAVKILEPKNHRRFQFTLPKNYLAEVCVWSQLQHDNILPLLGLHFLEPTVENIPTLVVPWAEYGTLEDYFKAQPDANRIAIMLQVARGLNYLHTRDPPIVHDDIRPHNIWVTAAGRACIANFDFSPFEDPTKDFDTTDTKRIYIARRYRAPDPGAGTPRSDTFAFVMFCWELFAGKRPYDDEPSSTAFTPLTGTRRPPRPESLTDDTIWEKLQLGWRSAPYRRPVMKDYVDFFESIANRNPQA